MLTIKQLSYQSYTIFLNNNPYISNIKSLEKAQELEPESPLNYSYLGFLRERQDRLEEAILAWQNGMLEKMLSLIAG